MQTPLGSTIGDMIQKLELTPDKAKEDKGEGISSREWRQRTRPSLETVTISHSGKSFCTPGNGGTALLENCENVPIPVDDFASMKQLVQEKGIELVVVGPELPLSLGIADYLQSHGVKVFGPSRKGLTLRLANPGQRS